MRQESLALVLNVPLGWGDGSEVKVLVTKHNGPSLIPGTYVVDGRKLASTI